jgi:hypothetical protein
MLGNLLLLELLLPQTCCMAFLQSNTMTVFSNINKAAVKRYPNNVMANMGHSSTIGRTSNKSRDSLFVIAPHKMTRKKDDQPEEEQDETCNNNPIKNVTIKQKGEVILYRVALISASVAYACNLLSHGLLATSNSGAGLSLDLLYHVENSSLFIYTWGILLAALVVPPHLGAITDTNRKNDWDNALFLLLNELLPTLAGFAIIAEVVNKIQENLSDPQMSSAALNSLDNIALVLVTLISWREIKFFGASYKVEAIFAIFCAVLLVLNHLIGFSEIALSGGLSLSLLVLSFGKIFEPLKEDLEPNESAFFQDDRIL